MAFATALEVDDAFIGRRVHLVMWDQKMSQTTLGSLLGIDQSTISKRLRGEVGWPATLVARTARVLNTTAAFLLGETDDPTLPAGPASNMRTPD